MTITIETEFAFCELCDQTTPVCECGDGCEYCDAEYGCEQGHTPNRVNGLDKQNCPCYS